MSSINSFISFCVERRAQIIALFIQHIQLTMFSILVSVLIGIPLAILIVTYRKFSVPVIGFTNIVQSIPSLALLGFLIPVVGIGSKPAIIMVVLYSLLPIVKNSFSGLTNISPSLIETAVVFNAMKAKDVDIYVEYTGTGLVNILKKPTMSDPTKVYNIVKQDFAKKHNLKTISDLAKISPNFKAGFTMEFANRSDGYPGIQKSYNLNFSNVKGIDGGLRYTSLLNNETQVLDAFSTDGLLKKFDLKLLKDDKNFFPPYYAIPVVREETLKKYPQLKGILALLDGRITDVDMRSMNYEVDNGSDPLKVANEFLRSEKLIK